MSVSRDSCTPTSLFGGSEGKNKRAVSEMSDKVAVSGEEEILSASAPFELQQLL